MCSALHILDDIGSITAEFQNPQAGQTGWSVATTSPWQCAKGVSITRQMQAANNGQTTIPRAPTIRPSKSCDGNRTRAFNIILTYTYTYHQNSFLPPKEIALQTAARSKLRTPFLAHSSPHIRRCWTLRSNIDHSRSSPKRSRCCAHGIDGDLNTRTCSSSA
jgi:hypothetical protein